MAVTLSVNYTQNSQSVTNNTSNVTVNAVAHWGGGSHNATGECYGSITIDGTKYSFSGIKFNTSQTSSGKQTVMTKTVNVTHNADGTKSLPISASFYTGLSSSGTQGAAATVELTTIPRKSSISSVSGGALGKQSTIKVTQQSSSFTHTLTYTCGSASGTIATKVKDTTIYWTPPLSLASQNTIGSGLTVTLKLTTYNGSTSLGTTSWTSNGYTIPNTVKPSCTVAVNDRFAYFSKYGAYVKGLSMLNVVITPTLAYSSPISTYNTTIGSDKYTGSQFATYDISAGSVTISSTVTDKRGNTSAAATATITVIDYATPKVTKLVAERCNQNGTANAQGEYVKVSFAYTVSTLNGKNTLKYYLKYKKSTDTTYTEATNLVPTSGSYIFAADKSSSYDIIYGVQDDFHHITRTTSASTAMVLMHWKSDGTAMGVGKMVEESNLFDVGLPTRFFDKVTLENDKSIFGTDVDGTICSALIPVSASGNTSLGYGLYNAKRGNTHLYGNKIQFYTNEGIYLNGNELYLNNDMRIYAGKPRYRLPRFG